MLKKLVNGEYSLKVTFWLFGLLGFFLFNVVTNIIHNGILRLICANGVLCSKSVILFVLQHIFGIFIGGGWILFNVGIYILVVAMFVIYIYLVLRGIWKSGAAYQGNVVWSVGAKIVLIVLAFISLKSII